MKENKENKKEFCAMSEASKIIGDFWNLVIINTLVDGCKRFNEIQEEIGDITNSTLSDRLKKLVDQDIIIRNQYQCIPPKVEYSLTEKGKGLEQVVKSIEKYGEKYLNV